jgi:hypothetical protein
MNQEIVVIVRIMLTSITMTRQQINVNTLITPDVEVRLANTYVINVIATNVVIMLKVELNIITPIKTITIQEHRSSQSIFVEVVLLNY